MKLNYLVLNLFAAIALFQLADSALIRKNDPRLRAESYALGNGRSLIISDHEPVLTHDGMRFQEKTFPRMNRKIDKEEDKNYCLGGESVPEDDLKSRLEKFSKSTCLPIVMAPGIMGTRLRALITDCNQLSEEIQSYCGFTKSIASRSCKSNKTEFDLWIAIGQDSPASFTASDRCFGHLIGLNLTALELADGSLPENLLDPNGISVTWYGNTPGSYQASDCGANAIQKLVNSMTGEGKGNALGDVMEGYSAMLDYLKDMGYTVGLNLFPMPYDWRRQAGNTDLSYNLKRTLELSKRINSKRTVIVTHSFGSLNTLEVLNRMTSKEKEELVERFVPIGPPFAGSFESNKKVITSTDEFSKVIVGFGMNDLRPILTSVLGLWDLFVKDVFEAQKGQKWALDLEERLKAEREQRNNLDFWKKENLPFNWFPNPTKKCTKQRGDKDYCGLHMYDYFVNPLLKVTEASGKLRKAYSASFADSVEFMEKYSIRSDAEINFILNLEKDSKSKEKGKIPKHSEVYLLSPEPANKLNEDEIWGAKKLIPKNRVEDLMTIVKKNKLNELQNPDVPVTLIYGANLETPTSMTIFDRQNPRAFTNEDKTMPNEKFELISGFGDESVTTDGSLTPLLKWGWEFDMKASKHPVQVVEYCSSYNEVLKAGANDKYSGSYSAPTTNTYNGIPCDNKNHGTLIGDQHLIKFIATILKSGKPSKLSPEILKLRKEDLDNLKAVCPGLNAPKNEGDLLKYGINPKNNPSDSEWLVSKALQMGINLASTGVGFGKTLGTVSGNAIYKTYGFLKNHAVSYFFSNPKMTLLSSIDSRRRGLMFGRRKRRQIRFHI